jgi:hypothetical protein
VQLLPPSVALSRDGSGATCLHMALALALALTLALTLSPALTLSLA